MTKLNLKKVDRLKWNKVAGPKKVSMRIHQYDRDQLKRIITLGTCPLGRGALAPTARIVSYLSKSRILIWARMAMCRKIKSILL